jgi:hypothetical protein
MFVYTCCAEVNTPQKLKHLLRGDAAGYSRVTTLATGVTASQSFLVDPKSREVIYVILYLL